MRFIGFSYSSLSVSWERMLKWVKIKSIGSTEWSFKMGWALEILRILKIYIYFVGLCCHVLHNKKAFS
jgi:hypothetical protein